MTALLKGIDHIYLSVTDFARAEAFYDAVMEALGLHKGDKAIAGERHAHYVAPTFQLTIRPARTDAPFDAYRAGLHHLCFQAADRAAVEACHQRLTALGVTVTAPAVYPEYNPEYYAVFFEDPDGIRLEVVARTSYRDALVARWEEFDTFLNPLQKLQAKEAGQQ